MLQEKGQTNPIASESQTVRPHGKVILLGVCALLSCVTVATVAFWGITLVHDQNEAMAHRDAPALSLLQQMERDLYQAQVALERASTDPAARTDHLKIFQQKIEESTQRYELFRQFALNTPGDLNTTNEYQAARVKWRTSVDKLLAAHGTTGGDEAERLVEAKQTFAAMVEPVEDLENEIYQPQIDQAAAHSEHSADIAKLGLLGCLALVLPASVFVIGNNVRTLRIQERAAAAAVAAREAESRRQTFEARLAAGMSMAQDEAGTLKLVEDIVKEVMPSVTSEILLADSSRAHLHQLACTKPEHRGCSVTKPGDCPAVRRGHRLTFETGNVFDACPHLKNRPTGDCSAVCVPLSIMGQTVGVMHTTGPTRQLPNEEQMFLLDQLASKSGERLGMIRAFARSEAQAGSDSLTGLMNRRSLEARVHELSRSRQPFAVAYGDLDHFKSLNDTHGHETGDKALRIFAQTLRSCVRPGDLTSRWGGEEFVLVMPGTSTEEAVAALERVRAGLAKTLQTAATPAFTVSFGVAETNGEMLFVDVLAKADEALLQAKRQGRNRTIAAIAEADAIASIAA